MDVEYPLKPLIGFIVAIVIVLLAIALLAALLLARFCCCCMKRNKEIYQVTPSKYKTLQPIYVVTPPLSERYGMAGASDGLYSSPHFSSGTPPSLSFPPPPAGINGIKIPRVQSPGGNREEDLSSTPKNKRSSIATQSRIERSERAIHSPQANMSIDADYAAVGTMEYPAGADGRVPPTDPSFIHLPPPSLNSPRSDASSLFHPSTLSAEGGDLPFLDPKRPRETQTREELIY